ncbi:MAG: hypothetical protein KatS3mg124_0537 [Porticoccaceae bacterium]|nr:MAG: hypothetical protein KatS3mg124_0537 [Porticoccaceae bacterium]
MATGTARHARRRRPRGRRTRGQNQGPGGRRLPPHPRGRAAHAGGPLRGGVGRGRRRRLAEAHDPTGHPGGVHRSGDARDGRLRALAPHPRRGRGAGQPAGDRHHRRRQPGYRQAKGHRPRRHRFREQALRRGRPHHPRPLLCQTEPHRPHAARTGPARSPDWPPQRQGLPAPVGKGTRLRGPPPLPPLGAGHRTGRVQGSVHPGRPPRRRGDRAQAGRGPRHHRPPGGQPGTHRLGHLHGLHASGAGRERPGGGRPDLPDGGRPARPPRRQAAALVGVGGGLRSGADAHHQRRYRGGGGGRGAGAGAQGRGATRSRASGATSSR